VRLLALGLLVMAAAWAQDCRSLHRRGKLAEARACHSRMAQSGNALQQAEALWYQNNAEGANNFFRAAVKAQPKNPEPRVRWGRFYLERNKREDAAALFEEALAVQPDYPPALIGMALVAAGSFDAKSVEFADQALKKDPKAYEAHEVLARFAIEDGNPTEAGAQADKALAISPEALDALMIRATIDWMEGKPGTEWIDRLNKVNPSHAEGYALAARIFVINRRYEEGIKLYRKAVELNPEYLPARSELGVNLMRLGEEDEAKPMLEAVYEAGFRDAATVNTLKLMDSYKNFVTIKKGKIILRLDKKEADLLRPYFERELERAVNVFEKKYELVLDRPVQLEVYPNHEDFAVRTMGLPGLGALGVTFGNVVAMDSPSGRKPGTFHWASTLWHELSHVYALAATKHRVPRWFTEGLAVHEETAVDPEWGDRLDPGAIRAMKDKKLLPIATLDKGFTRPSYPNQVIVSYFQAGKICDYIEGKWGWQTLLAMLRDFATGAGTPAVVEKHLKIKPEEFDKEFLAWLEKSTESQVKGFEEWTKRLRAMSADVKAKNWDKVIPEAEALGKIYPDYVEAGSPYEILADAHLEKKNTAGAIAALNGYAKAGGRYPATLKKLAKLLDEAGQPEQAARALERINFIYPVQDEEMHRLQGELWLKVGNTDKAIREFQASVFSKPIDAATSYYNLARAYRAAGQLDNARDNLVSALEAAPSFRPAQKLLLELSK
jgi:tetratricopeptide (TPR) repeat protein